MISSRTIHPENVLGVMRLLTSTNLDSDVSEMKVMEIALLYDFLSYFQRLGHTTRCIKRFPIIFRLDVIRAGSRCYQIACDVDAS